MRLTKYELELFIGVLKSRRMYRNPPCATRDIGYEDWEQRTLEKLINELYISYGAVPSWK